MECLHCLKETERHREQITGRKDEFCEKIFLENYIRTWILVQFYIFINTLKKKKRFAVCIHAVYMYTPQMQRAV